MLHWVFPLGRNCSWVHPARHCLHPTKMISSRRVHIIANKVKTWLNQALLLRLVLDYWQWHSDIQELAFDIQGLRFHRWGLCLWEGWESRTFPTSSWETISDEASFIVSASGLKAPFIIFFWKIEEPFSCYLKKYLWMVWDVEFGASGMLSALCFKHNFKNRGKSSYSKSKLNLFSVRYLSAEGS